MRADVLAVMALLSLGAGHVSAADSLRPFETIEQQRFYEELLKEYRCLKCQNQNLADSNADLASDLRNEIYTQVQTGADASSIDNYLVSRYGEFVRYSPRLSRVTWVLWFGPFVLLVLAMFLAGRYGKGSRRRVATEAGPDESHLAAARSVLEERAPGASNQKLSS